MIGILKPDGTLNMEQMKILMEEAGDMSVTLHRAFDVCADPYETLEQAVSLGIDTILTSGQKNICTLGTDLLKDLVDRSAGRIVIRRQRRERGCDRGNISENRSEGVSHVRQDHP